MGHSRSLKMASFNRSHTTSCLHSIVTFNCIISETNQDIGWKSRFFHTPCILRPRYGGPRRNTKTFGTEKLERWIYQKVKKMRVYSFFAPRCYAFTSVKRCPSVRPSVRPSRSWILSKRINIYSTLFRNRVAKPFWFFYTKRHGNIPTAISPPLTGASTAGVVGRNLDSEPTCGSIACCERGKRQVRHTQLCDGPWRVDDTSRYKRRSLLMAGDDNEVYNKKPQRYTEDNRAAFNCTQW